MTTEKKEISLHGVLANWDLGPKLIQFYVVQAKYGLIRRFFKAKQFDSKTGEGEQRGKMVSWAKHLKKCMADGTYRPTVAYSTVGKEHYDNNIVKIHHGKVTIYPKSEYPISLTDSQHRFEALELIRAESSKMQQKVDNLPVIMQINLNTHPVEDFIAYQKGKPVDKTHILSMKIMKKMLGDNHQWFLETGLEIAKILNEQENSPWKGLVRLETQSEGIIPLNTLMAQNASDISTSLVGAARVVKLCNKNAEWMADNIKYIHSLIETNHPELLSKEKILSQPPKGTKGGACLLIGLGILIGYLEKIKNSPNISEDDDLVSEILEACEKVFNKDSRNNMSGPMKRVFIGDLAKELFKTVSPELLHEGIPKELISLLSTSSLNVSAIPKTKNAPRKKKNKEVVIDNVSENDIMDDTSDLSNFFSEDENDGFFDLKNEQEQETVQNFIIEIEKGKIR